MIARHSYTPTINELLAFAACARLGTTTRAAEELHLTQSAISRSINALEDRLGVRLFHRVKQRLLLSDAGRALYREAESVLADIDRAAVTVMAFGGHSAVLRMAVLPTFANIWLIPRLSDFQAQEPALTFDIVSSLTPVDFETAPYDAAIQRAHQRPAGAHADPLMDEALVVVAAPSLLKANPVLDEGDIAKLPLLQQATRPSLWLDWFRDAGLDSRTILRGARFEHFGMVINAAVAGMGAAIVPEMLVRQELEAERLVLASERRLESEAPYCLIYPERSLEIPGFERFRDWLIGRAHERS